MKNNIVKLPIGHKLVDELDIRFTDEEFEILLSDGLIIEKEPGRYEYTEYGLAVINR